MRTTIRLDDDVAAAAEQLQRERHIGLSEAVNSLAREGMHPRRPRREFRQRTSRLGLTADVSDIAGTLELLDDAGTSLRDR